MILAITYNIILRYVEQDLHLDDLHLEMQLVKW